MAEALLEVTPGVGAAGPGGELAGRQGGRDRDHAHPRRLDRRSPQSAIGGDRGAEVVELLGGGDAVAEAEPDHLGRVGDRAAAQGDDQIGAGLARHIGCGDDIAARRMRADPGEEPGKAVAERLPQPLDEAALPRQGAARQHKDGAGVEPVDLLRQRLGEGRAEDHILHLRKAVGAGQHCSLQKPPTPGLAMRRLPWLVSASR